MNQLLLAAADLLETHHWTTYADARDAQGNRVAPTDQRATAFCALGSLNKVDPTNWMAPARVLRDYIKRTTSFHTIMEWNDAQTDASTIIDTLRRAAQ